MTKQERDSITLNLRTDLVGRLNEVADKRVVGRNLLVEFALERYLDALPPLEGP